MRCWVINGFS